jgi:hypothetical protein
MVSQKRFPCSVYEVVAELIGKAKDLDEFYRFFVKFAQEDNPKFSIEKFYKAVQKAHQFGGIGTGYEGIHIRGQ